MYNLCVGSLMNSRSFMAQYGLVLTVYTLITTTHNYIHIYFILIPHCRNLSKSG